MNPKIKIKPKITVVEDIEDLAGKSLEMFFDYAKKAIKNEGVFRFAVSGGYTPRRFYEMLGESSMSKKFDWSKAHIFWVDERYVDIESDQNNYKMANETFLKKINIPEDNIHRIPTRDPNFETSARQYENTIRNVFSVEPCQLPVFDLVVLGMGSDGHTGSLFPDSYAALDTENLVCVVYCMNDKLNRITLTSPVISAAEHIMVLVSGEEKASVLKAVLNSKSDDVRYPIHFLWPVLNKVAWIVDKAAAKNI
ncbi:MAG: 6-phosphogluconolactonase [Phycisphaerae bacterium]|nr:6-phosphogluconolactonase [Phycisphaerae bacterium]